MKKCVIFGTSQFAQLLGHFLQLEGEYEVAAFTAQRQFIPDIYIYILDKPVVPFEDLPAKYPPEEYDIFVCVGYNRMNQVRERVFALVREKGYRIQSYIHPTAIVYSEELGEGTIVMEGAIIGAFTRLGAGNIVYAGAHIAHHTTVGDFNFFAVNAAVAGDVEIGKGCFFGNNCTVRDAVRVGDHTLVGAGCYLAHDTEPYSVEVPARSVTLLGKSSLDIGLVKPKKE